MPTAKRPTNGRAVNKADLTELKDDFRTALDELFDRVSEKIEYGDNSVKGRLELLTTINRNAEAKIDGVKLDAERAVKDVAERLEKTDKKLDARCDSLAADIKLLREDFVGRNAVSTYRKAIYVTGIAAGGFLLALMGLLFKVIHVG